MRLLELHDDLPTAVEVGERAGRPVIRMLRGARLTDDLTDHLDDLLGGQAGTAGPKHRRPRRPWLSRMLR